MKTFGFKVNKRIFDIEAETEQKALIKLVKSGWGWTCIDKAENIELLGELGNATSI